MKTRSGHYRKEEEKLRKGKVEVRKDLQDASKGKDLSYLNEMPQMAGYEGVKAGLPPPEENNSEEQDTCQSSSDKK